jgi:hypothetical protein
LPAFLSVDLKRLKLLDIWKLDYPAKHFECERSQISKAVSASVNTNNFHIFPNKYQPRVILALLRCWIILDYTILQFIVISFKVEIFAFLLVNQKLSSDRKSKVWLTFRHIQFCVQIKAKKKYFSAKLLASKLKAYRKKRKRLLWG